MCFNVKLSHMEICYFWLPDWSRKHFSLENHDWGKWNIMKRWGVARLRKVSPNRFTDNFPITLTLYDEAAITNSFSLSLSHSVMCCILRASSLVTAIYNGPTQTDGGIQNNFSRFFFAATQRDCLDIALIMCVCMVWAEQTRTPSIKI